MSPLTPARERPPLSAERVVRSLSNLYGRLSREYAGADIDYVGWLHLPSGEVFPTSLIGIEGALVRFYSIDADGERGRRIALVAPESVVFTFERVEKQPEAPVRQPIGFALPDE